MSDYWTLEETLEINKKVLEWDILGLFFFSLTHSFAVFGVQSLGADEPDLTQSD